MTESHGHTVRIAVERTHTFASQSPADREQSAAMASGNGYGYLADRVLSLSGSVAAIAGAHPADQTIVAGISEATAVRIAAPLQLARRAIGETATGAYCLGKRHRGRVAAIALAAAMRYPDWFRAQVVQAVTLHGLSYSRASHLYDVTDETIRKWVTGAGDASAGLDRMEALEHRVARIEHYFALAEVIRRQGGHECRPLHRVECGNGHNGFDALHDLSHATAAERGGGRS